MNDITNYEELGRRQHDGYIQQSDRARMIRSATQKPDEDYEIITLGTLLRATRTWIEGLTHLRHHRHHHGHA